MRLDLNTGDIVPPKLDLDALLGAEKPRIRFTSDISKDMKSHSCDISKDIQTGSSDISKDIRESLDNDEKHISKDIPSECSDISKDIQDDTFGEESDISKDIQQPQSDISKDIQCEINRASFDISLDISSEEKKRQFIRKYRKENYKTLSLDIKKDDLKRFQNKAKSLGMSMRELVLKAVEAYNEGE